MSTNSLIRTPEDFDSMLYFGYHIDKKDIQLQPEIRNSVTKSDIEGNKEDLVEKGIMVLDSVFDSIIEDIEQDKTHIVPLSGGLDSRTILGALFNHERVNKSQIITVTFGVPGTWDFELGRKVARDIGVENIPIDLTDVNFLRKSEDLIECANQLSNPVPILEAYINSIPYKKFRADNTVFWSGFMGDPSLGDHQPKNPSKNWNESIQSFISLNKSGSRELSKTSFHPEIRFPTKPFIDRERLTYEEQLDCAIRQQKYIKPVTVPSDTDYRTPLMTEEWLSFWMNLPFSCRKDRACFKQVILAAYPHLFNQPSATNYGLSITKPSTLGKIHGGIQIVHNLSKSKLFDRSYIHPNENYTNFGDMFRKANPLSNIAEILLQSLNKRDINHVDISKIWKEHQQGIDHSDSIQTLISIECFIQSRDS